MTTPIETVLVVMAHPDDAEFCCGGVVKQLTDKGTRVVYVVLTNGDKGNHDTTVTVAQLVARRMDEQR
ncbi:MAG: PIG-L family deacetylase, partial [Anaerolineae bacterium]|nr:PIG-L family deacetylase [Anaerolineae bacterium]